MKKFDLDVQENNISLKKDSEKDVQPDTLGPAIKASLKKCPTTVCFSFGCGNK
ncbi:type A lantibiotic [Staphylococcus hominis]|uniref:type A lantibiotic n=1 Tax=Staphylococcus hominis TaxID=1290 RepID=UPI001F58A008|nr:type A lantibiotic [Staphylococcus hominis]MCI2870182.1 type A lantibiotic [Staphylococcus hominis]MDS3894754.1 type A lantibiotic [Staphylococcus hominis]